MVRALRKGLSENGVRPTNQSLFLVVRTRNARRGAVREVGPPEIRRPDYPQTSKSGPEPGSGYPRKDLLAIHCSASCISFAEYC